MIVVNVEKFGDWDTPYTVVSMVAPTGMDKGTARTIAKQAEALAKDTDNEDSTVRLLKDHGFTPASTIGLTIGGNL